jgi:hypothetical protein
MTEDASPETPPTPEPAPTPKPANGHAKAKKAKAKPASKPERAYPRAPLERAIAVALALKNKNGGEPWAPEDVASAMGMALGNNRFFYEASSAQKFGLCEGGRDAKEISLTPFGRELVYAVDASTDLRLRREAFLKVTLFKQALEHYKSPDAIDMQYVGNVLKGKFGLELETHEEFVKLFKENCEFVAIKTLSDATTVPVLNGKSSPAKGKVVPKAQDDIVTIAEPDEISSLKCFVIMPFVEKGHTPRPPGFFQEVLTQVIVPAAKAAGFAVQTARKKGTEVIQVTIVNNVMDADLVVADLTDHNPSVFLELGMRLRHDQPVCIIKAKGTPPVFDVDYMLRVEEYDPNLWASSIAQDVPKLTEHIRATWEDRDSQDSFFKILRRGGAAPGRENIVN